MLGHFKKIKCHTDFCELFQRIALEVAPIHLSDKPATLIQLNPCSKNICKRPLFAFSKYKNLLAWHINLEYRILRQSENGILVLFYSKEALEKIIQNSEISSFLQNAGYTTNSLDVVMDTLESHFNETEKSIPHEIGIFLGYPLKDVKGFIEKQKPEPIPQTLWRIFGDPSESLKLMDNFNKATKQIASIFGTDNDIEQVSTFFRKSASSL